MPSGKNKMDKNSEDHLLTMQSIIDANRKYFDEKMKTYDSKLDKHTDFTLL